MSPHITFTAAIMAVLNAGLSLLLAFGVNVTEAQTAAITGFANAVLLLDAADPAGDRRVEALWGAGDVLHLRQHLGLGRRPALHRRHNGLRGRCVWAPARRRLPHRAGLG